MALYLSIFVPIAGNADHALAFERYGEEMSVPFDIFPFIKKLLSCTLKTSAIIKSILSETNIARLKVQRSASLSTPQKGFVRC